MRRISTLVITGLLCAASTTAVQAAEPAAGDRPERNGAGNLRAQCKITPLRPATVFGTITTDDCPFDNGGIEQREDLYLVQQGRQKSRGGDSMLTFTVETLDFDWIFGIGDQNPGGVFPDPVHAFRRGPAGVYDINGFAINTFSIVGAEPVYKLWVGGQGPEQLGEYSLDTRTEATTDTCEAGHRVYLQGDVTFSSSIANERSCRGTIEFGPNAGLPLNYQYWWVRLDAGETITLSLSGIEDPTMAAAIVDFGTGEVALDLGAGPGDTDRSVTFTTSRTADFYVEVSSAPDVTSPYDLTFEVQ